MPSEGNRQVWLTTLAQRLSPESAVLLVLDMLKGSPDAPPSMEVARVREPLQHLIRLIASARRVALPIIYVRNSHSDWTALPNWKEGWSRRSDWHPFRYTEGTRAVEFHDGLEPRADEAVLIKHSYSAFAHGPLDLMLRSKGLKSVLLTGGAVVGAVEAAAKECFVRGYYLVMVGDCMVPSSGPDYEIVMKNTAERLGAILASSEQIVSIWDARPPRARGWAT